MRKVYFDPSDIDDDEIYKISFYSANEGYVGLRDWIGFTTDSGHTFTKKYINLNNVDFNGYGVNLTFGFFILGLKAFNQNTLIVYGHYGLVPSILYSTNGGNSFTLVYHSQYDPNSLRTGITDMIFPQNGNIGFAVDADRILKTTDKGLTWATVYTDPARYYDYLEAADDQNVFAISTDYTVGALFKTTNSGSSWSQVTLPAGHITYACFLNPSEGWLCSLDDDQNGRIFYTNNGGTGWTQKNHTTASPFTCSKMKFINDSTGFALSSLYTVFETTDSGKVWEQIPRDNNFTHLGYSHNDLQVFNNTQLWAGGGYGFLELNTNLSAKPLPKALFRIDTSGLYQTGTVNLVNYSKTAYQFKWFKNGALIGTSYNSSYIHVAGIFMDTLKLVVSNGTNTDTLIQYQSFFPPVIVSSFTPATGISGTVVTITGQNFTSATAVLFGNVNASSFTVQSSTSIKATVGSGASGSVKVVTPRGSGFLPGFTYVPPPAITSFLPAIAASGSTITITGKNFTGASQVNFGGVPAASFNVVNSTTITAVVGEGASGTVEVVTIGGKASLTGFNILPTLSGFTPMDGTYGTYLKISGTGLGSLTAITVGGVSVRSFKINSNTSVTAIIGSGASGAVTVSSGYGSSTLAGFSWFPPPTIADISPQSGPVGTTVTITGTHFDPVFNNNQVYFGAMKATVISGTSTSLVVTVPSGANFQPVTVTSNHLTASSSQPFLVTFPDGGSLTINSYSPRQDISVGTDNTAHYVTPADFDGDGKIDLAVTIIGYYVIDNGVSILRNTSTGSTVSFGPKLDFKMSEAGSMAVADIDGDGKLDLAVTCPDQSSFYVFRNTSVPGTISFEAPKSFKTSSGAGAIAIQDLNGDGKPDVATGALTVFKNISDPGNIAFESGITLPTGGGANVVISDFNDDKKPDIALATWNNQAIYVVKNTSTLDSLSFGPLISFPTTAPYTIAAGDVDGDGKPDLVAANNVGSKVSVLKNNSNLSSLSFTTPVEFDTPTGTIGLALSDLDGDGKLDVGTNEIDYNLTVLKNISSPGQVNFGTHVDYTPGRFLGHNAMTFCDINGDGKPDAVVAAEMTRAVSIYLNNVKPAPFINSFSPTIGITGTTVEIRGINFTGANAVSFGGVPAASFTVNSDTSITVLVGTGSAGDVIVTTPVGTASKPGFAFGYPPVITDVSPAAGPAGSSVVITGANFDTAASNNQVFFGNMLATINASSSNAITVQVPAAAIWHPITVTTHNLTAFSSRPFITTFTGGSSAFTENSFAPRWDYSGAGGGYGAVADIDGDRKPDIICPYSGSAIGISRNTTSGPDISFAPAVTLPVTGQAGRLAAGDLDGDNKPDLVSTTSANSICLFRNTSSTGAISFTPKLEILTGASTTNPTGVYIHDLDGDGKPDVVVSNYSAQTISVFKNKSTPGNLAFDTRLDYALGGYGTDVFVADLNEDGKPEIMATVNGSNLLSVFKNSSIPGTIILEPKIDLPVAMWPSSIVVGDIDGDGKSDLVVANTDSNSVSILRNTGNAGLISFAPKVDYTVGYAPTHAGISDLDGDGKPDVYCENSSGSSLSVLKNLSSPGTMSLASKFDYPLPAVNAYPNSGTTGDLDGDGKPDLIAFNLGGSISIFKNNSAGLNIKACDKSATTLTSSLTGSSYQWQVNTGSGFVNISDDSHYKGTNSVNLQLSAILSTWNNYRYRCIINGVSASATILLNVMPAPVADAGPDRSICSGSSSNIGTQPATGNTYVWTSNPAGFTSSSAYPTVTPSATTAYYLEVNNGVCSSRDTVKVTVSTPVPLVVTITTPVTNICPGTPVTFSSAINNGSALITYRWTINDSAAGTDSATFTSSSLKNNDAVKLTVTSIAGCVSPSTAISNIITMQVNPIPAAPTITAGGSTSICSGNSVRLTSSVNQSGQWYKDTAAINGATNYTFDATQAGRYTFKAGNGSCYSAASNAIVVTVINVTTTPTITASGSTSPCAGSAVILTSSIASGNQWYKNGVAISGATGQTYTATVTGSYTVSIISGSCTSAFSNPIDVTFNAIPAAPAISSSGNTTFCQGSSVTLSSSAVIGNQWYKNNAIINGATGQSYQANESGAYYVKLTSGNCWVFSDTVLVQVNSIPVTPAIAQTGNVLTSSAAAGNQWYLDGNAIANANGQSYTPGVSGIYTVRVTLNGCSSSFSAGVNMVITAVISPNLDSTIIIAPNPVTSHLKVHCTSNFRLQISVMDINGKYLVQHEGFNNDFDFDMNRNRAGSYIVEIVNTRTKEQTRRLIIKL